MRPGARSDDGFPGETESLSEVLARDERTLAELCISRDELAEKLALLIEAADYVYLPALERIPFEGPWLDKAKTSLETIRAKVEAGFGSVSIEHLAGEDVLVGGRYEITLTRYLGVQRT